MTSRRLAALTILLAAVLTGVGATLFAPSHAAAPFAWTVASANADATFERPDGTTLRMTSGHVAIYEASLEACDDDGEPWYRRWFAIGMASAGHGDDAAPTLGVGPAAIDLTDGSIASLTDGFAAAGSYCRSHVAFAAGTAPELDEMGASADRSTLDVTLELTHPSGTVETVSIATEMAWGIVGLHDGFAPGDDVVVTIDVALLLEALPHDIEHLVDDEAQFAALRALAAATIVAPG